MILTAVLCVLVVQQVAAAGYGDGDGASALAEQAVLAAYKRMEEADRKGDVSQWFAMRDRKTLEAMSPAVKDSIRKSGHPRPAVKYQVVTVRVGGDRAVLFGKVTDPSAAAAQHQSVLFVMEDGQWKVGREQWSETPFDHFVLYGMLPPAGGAFMHAGSPWKRVAYAQINTEVVGKKDVLWKVQAVSDDAYLYLRYEWIAEIPAPGSKVKPELADAGKTGGPPPPPSMEIKTGGASDQPDGPRDLTIAVSDVVSTRGNQSFVGYSLYVKNAAGADVFEYSLGSDSAGRLLAVQDRFVEVRIPTAGLGLALVAKPKVQLEEAGAVLHYLPYTVEAFSGK